VADGASIKSTKVARVPHAATTQTAEVQGNPDNVSGYDAWIELAIRMLSCILAMMKADNTTIMPPASTYGPECIRSTAGTLVSCGRDNVVRVVDLRMFEARATLKAPGFAVGAVWTNACLGPDERHAAAGVLRTFCPKLPLYPPLDHDSDHDPGHPDHAPSGRQINCCIRN
jgi:hypothetical protein